MKRATIILTPFDGIKDYYKENMLRRTHWLSKVAYRKGYLPFAPTVQILAEVVPAEEGQEFVCDIIDTVVQNMDNCVFELWVINDQIKGLAEEVHQIVETWRDLHECLPIKIETYEGWIGFELGVPEFVPKSDSEDIQDSSGEDEGDTFDE